MDGRIFIPAGNVILKRRDRRNFSQLFLKTFSNVIQSFAAVMQ
jgi:hypothetical protein